MDKQIEKTLRNFDAVWQRVAASKAEGTKSNAKNGSNCGTPLMPRRCNKKPGRRFECGR